MATTDDRERPLSEVRWSSAADAAGPVLRAAAGAALLTQARLQVSYDRVRGEYDLGMTTRS